MFEQFINLFIVSTDISHVKRKGSNYYDKKIIYFLRTGNSCRSQMAEGWAKYYLDDSWEVKSAGMEVHGLHPKAVQAMKEVGVDISNQKSEIIDRDILNRSHRVMTLCEDANDRGPASALSCKKSPLWI